MFALVVIASSIWMASDASRIGYDKHDVDGLGAMGPAGWLLCGLFLWIVAFPMYLIKRPALKAAADRKRLRMQAFAGALPGAVYPGAPYGGAPYGGAPYGAAANPYGPPQQGYPGGQPGYPPQQGYPPRPQPGYPPPPQQGYPPAPGYPQSQPQNPYGAPAASASPAAPNAGPMPSSSGTAPGPYGAAPPPSDHPSATKPAATHASASDSLAAGDIADGIRQLSDLRDRGLLNEAEYQARKSQLLSRV